MTSHRGRAASASGRSAVSTATSAAALAAALASGAPPRLVEALTDAWGSERSGRGTTVWFELVLPAS